jgi:hypothetical protein
VTHLEQSSRSGFDLERFVLANQLFQQRGVHLIPGTLNHESAFANQPSLKVQRVERLPREMWTQMNTN